MIQYIIEIISPVRPHRHIRRIETHLALPVQGILIPGINYALQAPASQVIYRSRPAHVIPHAKHISIVIIMGAIHIDPLTEYIGLPVRYVFPAGKIGIKGLFLCRLHLHWLIFFKLILHILAPPAFRLY